MRRSVSGHRSCCCWPSWRRLSVGGEYSGAAIFVAEYSPDRKRGFMGSWLDFGSIAGFVMGAGVVVLISSIVGEANFLDWGWRIRSSSPRRWA